MKTFFSNIAKTKKGKIQLLTMALSTLLAIVFTIILIAFGAQQCKYNSPYKFEMNVMGYSMSEEITLKDDGTVQLFINDNGSTELITSQYYISNGNLFVKEVGASTFNLAGKISYYELKMTVDGMTISLQCEDTITAKNVCITFLVLSFVAIASMIAWILIEKYLKNRKPATQNVPSTPTANKEVETAQTETKEETVEEPKEVEKETTSTDTSAKE